MMKRFLLRPAPCYGFHVVQIADGVAFLPPYMSACQVDLSSGSKVKRGVGDVKGNGDTVSM